MRDILVKLTRRGESEAFISLTGESVVSYSVRETLCAEGLPLGAAAAKQFTLVLDASRAPDMSSADGARVQAYLRDGNEYTPFGCWYISACRADEDAAVCTLTGADALESGFEAHYTDSEQSYPQTLRQLARSVCAAADCALSEAEFQFSSLALSRLPEWSGDVTCRRILQNAAFLAGGFARINYEGKAEMISCYGGEIIRLAPEDYVSYARTGGAAFQFSALLYRHAGESAYTKYALDASAAVHSANSVKAEGNPLATSARLADTASFLTGCACESGEVTFMPDMPVQAGDRIILTDRQGRTHELLVNALKSVYDARGLSCEAACRLPPRTGEAGLSRRGVFAPDGSLNFEAIGEVTEKVLALARAYVQSLTAGEIRTDGLLAKIIEAARLRASEISAAEVTTDALTAAAAEIVNATVRKLEAGSVSTDALLSALVNAVSIKAERISAADVDTDRFAAALARACVLIAGTASFDRATVKHLISGALNVTHGAAGEVYIENLAASYASLLRADVGSICVKAADGNFYELNVDASTGGVSAVRASVGAAESARGVTDGGRAIIETSLNVQDLSAATLKGVYALINRLDAARIDADGLFAREAFISRLNAQDITANTYLRAALTQIDEGLSSAREQLDGSEPLLENIRRCMTFDDDGLRQGKSGSVYTTLVNETGFHIERRGSVGYVGSFERDGLATGGVTLGGIRASRTVRGGWVWTEVT